MALARSTVTAQGQISVPSEVRRRLGIGPGSAIEWLEVEGTVIVRKAGKYSLEDTRTALGFDQRPKRRSTKDLRAGIGEHMRKRNARH